MGCVYFLLHNISGQHGNVGGYRIINESRKQSLVIPECRHFPERGWHSCFAGTQWRRVYTWLSSCYLGCRNTEYLITSKTTLLKCLAELVPYDQGTIKLMGKSPSEYGIPQWRSRVMYVPQRPAVHSGTPLDLFNMAKNFRSQKEKASMGDPVRKGRKEWSINANVLFFLAG